MNVADANARCYQTFSRQIPIHVMHVTENTGRRANDSATCCLRLATRRQTISRTMIIVFLNSRRAEIVDDMTTELAEKREIKLCLTCSLSMYRHSVDGDLYISEPFIRTDIIRLLHVSTA